MGLVDPALRYGEILILPEVLPTPVYQFYNGISQREGTL